jgi:hypothetical protein
MYAAPHTLYVYPVVFSIGASNPPLVVDFFGLLI